MAAKMNGIHWLEANAFPSCYTLIWALFVVGFTRRRVSFPEINKRSRDVQDLGTFVGWFVIFILGVAVASMWLTDAWHFTKDAH
jgi:succinate-acetate transporter protein